MTEQNTTAIAVRDNTPPPVSVREVKAQTEAIHKLFKEVLIRDTHYGVIPGTGDKPSLYKAGAEKVGLLLHLAPSFQRDMQWDGPHLTVTSECTLRHQATGTVIASAGALCTTRETKYAFRQATRKCPKCGKTSIIKGKKEYGGGWLCFAKKGGCGAKWADGAKEIEGQSEEREENPNLADTYNTVMKMADKRAFVAATLFGTAASDIFTQDTEDFGVYEDEGAPAPARPVTSDAALPSDEFEALALGMEQAFERGEGRSWWTGNKAGRDLCSDEQRSRLGSRAKELADATGQASDHGPTPTPVPGPYDPASAEPPKSVEGKPGASTESFRAAWRGLHAAFAADGMHGPYMYESVEPRGKLHAAEQRALNVEYDRLEAVHQSRGQESLGV